MTQKTWVVDFETYYANKYTLRTMPMQEYIKNKKFEAQVFAAVCVESKEAVVLTGEEISKESLAFLNGQRVAAHNAYFDGLILSHHYGVTPAVWVDTQAMARQVLCNGPTYRDRKVSLDELSRTLLMTPKLSDNLKDVKGLHWDEMSTEQQNRLMLYCLLDALWAMRLYRIFIRQVPEFDMQCNDLLCRIYIERPLRMNVKLLGKMLMSQLRLLASMLESVEYEKEDFLSARKFADMLTQHGVPVSTTEKGNPSLSKHSSTITAALSGEYGEVAKKLAEIRLELSSATERARIKRFLSIYKTTSDNRVHFGVRHYAAHTGRGGGLDKINPQNFTRGSSLRKAILPPEGKVFIVGDSSNIEARVLAMLAGEESLLDAFRNKRDVYSEFATDVFKKKIDKTHPAERFVGKTCILGLGFGVGPSKLFDTINNALPTFGVDPITTLFAEQLVNIYRRKYYKIPVLWKRIELVWNRRLDELRLPMGVHLRWEGETMVAHLPTGRRIVYQQSMTTNVWHGLITENIVQSLANILVYWQMLQLEKFFPVNGTVHDEIIMTVPQEQAAKAKKITEVVMSTVPRWAKGLPIACEVGIGNTYGDAK